MTLRIKRADWNPLAICQVFTAEGEPVPMSTKLSEMKRYGQCFFFSASTGDIMNLNTGLNGVGSFDPKAKLNGEHLVFEVSA